MGNEISVFLERHFGQDSDFAKTFLQPKALENGNASLHKSASALAVDDRLYAATKEAIVATARPDMQYPEANWTKEQTATWWNTNISDLLVMQGQWSGTLPTDIEDSVNSVKRMVQGVNVLILKKKDLFGAPVVMYIHGGGFGGGSFNDVVYKNYLYRLAALGKCIVIAVDHAPIASKSYAAALNDCALVTQAAANGKITGIREGPVMLAGNSTGASLALATAVKANKEGWVEKISGIYAICPMAEAVASGPKYPSMKEFNGYYISEGYLHACVNMVKDETNSAPSKALFPMSASQNDLKGLPPTKVIVYQLDMLRDMGIAMHFKLMKAGVEASFNITSGGVHDQHLFTSHSPEVTQSSINDMAQFSQYALEKSGAGSSKKKKTSQVQIKSVAGDAKSTRSASVSRAGSVKRGVNASSNTASTKATTATRRNSIGSQKSTKSTKTARSVAKQQQATSTNGKKNGTTTTTASSNRGRSVSRGASTASTTRSKSAASRGTRRNGVATN